MKLAGKSLQLIAQKAEQPNFSPAPTISQALHTSGRARGPARQAWIKAICSGSVCPSSRRTVTAYMRVRVVCPAYSCALLCPRTGPGRGDCGREGGRCGSATGLCSGWKVAGGYSSRQLSLWVHRRARCGGISAMNSCEVSAQHGGRQKAYWEFVCEFYLGHRYSRLSFLKRGISNYAIQ